MIDLQWKKCNKLGAYFAVDIYEGEKYLLTRAMLEDGSPEGDMSQDSYDGCGQVEECPKTERHVLEELFPEDLDALKSIAFY